MDTFEKSGKNRHLTGEERRDIDVLTRAKMVLSRLEALGKFGMSSFRYSTDATPMITTSKWTYTQIGGYTYKTAVIQDDMRLVQWDVEELEERAKRCN